MNLFLGIVGVQDTLLSFSALAAFHYLGWLTFEWPPNMQTWLIMTMYAVCSFIVGYCWARASIRLGPALAFSMYTLLTFPIIIWQDLSNDSEPVEVSEMYLLGAVLIVIAFIAITVLDF
jgi:hypothetical protein